MIKICQAATSRGNGGVIAIHAIDGMPGVGKTALALHLADSLADHFRDGMRYASLDAHTPGKAPADPATVLFHLLRDEGVQPKEIPDDLPRRSAQWHRITANQRIILILDNAASSSQVLPLLPGSSDSLVLVTSRRHLGDLPTAIPVLLGILPPDESVQLFTQLARREVKRSDAAYLASLAGYLPLAITLLAAIANKHPAWSLDDLISEAKARMLTMKAEQVTVATAFDLSYDHLPANLQRLLRLLGLNVATEFDQHAAAALAGVPIAEAADLLSELHDHRLIEEIAYRRYRMHDLIRGYARRLAAADSNLDRERAVGRLLDYYEHTALVAGRYLSRQTNTIEPGALSPVAHPVGSRQEAKDWLDREYSNLRSWISHVAAQGDSHRAMTLTHATSSYLAIAGPWEDALCLQNSVIEQAKQEGNWRHAASALNHVGTLHRLMGANRLALRAHASSLRTFRAHEDLLGQANARSNLGIAQYLTNQYAAARRSHNAALGAYRELADRLGQANAHYRIGIVDYQETDYTKAIENFSTSLDIYRALEDQFGQAEVQRLLGLMAYKRANYEEAKVRLRLAIDLCEEVGDLNGQANALNFLGITVGSCDSFGEAIAIQSHALSIARRIGSLVLEGNSLYYLGIAEYLSGDYAASARHEHDAYLALKQTGDPSGQANTLHYLALCQHQLGDTASPTTPAGAPHTVTGKFEEALTTYRNGNNRNGVANVLNAIGTVRYQTGDLAGARQALDEALATHREHNDREGEAEVLNNIAVLERLCGNNVMALETHLTALKLARELSALLEIARALDGVGRTKLAIKPNTHKLSDQTELAEALSIYDRLGASEAARLRSDLATEFRT